MKIAMIAREVLTIPPSGYGGSERLIFDLTECLVKMGYQVYLFAKKGSRTSATLIEYPEDMEDIVDFVSNNLPLDIDIIHDNTEFIVNESYYGNRINKEIPVLFTLHYASRLDYEYRSIIYPSNFMKNLINSHNELDNVVYHGINVEDYYYKENKSDYLLYMGILKFNKGVHTAIEVANKLGKRLVIAGPQDSDDSELVYFKNYVEPHLNDKIQYIGTVKGELRKVLLSNAKALIFPTLVETFGLVSVEAMASGTPVLFLDRATSKEIIPEIFNQCICSDSDEMAEVIKNNLPSSKEVFEHVRDKFSVEIMAEGYIKKYNELIEKGRYEMKDKKQTISLCMIAKNEEKTIGRCLESVYDLVDEIIIVDTGSTDRTKEICSHYTDKIYDFEWIYDFSAARNHSISFATCDYIMFLDCDDMLNETSRRNFKKLKQKMDGTIDLYWFYYDYRHDAQGNSTYSFLTERLFKNHKGVKWNCIVHEVLQLGDLANNSEKTDIRITHTSNHDNTDKYTEFFRIKTEELGYTLNAREKYFYAMELYKHGENDKCYKLLIEILENPEGVNLYEKSSICNMLGYICKDRGNYFQGIKYFMDSCIYHQPLVSLYYEIAECYRALNMIDHSMFYYNAIISNIFFKEKFSNESVYSNFEEENNKYKIKSLLSLVLIHYNVLKDPISSKLCNDKLLEIEPNNESGIFNKKFFDSIGVE